MAKTVLCRIILSFNFLIFLIFNFFYFSFILVKRKGGTNFYSYILLIALSGQAGGEGGEESGRIVV